MNDRLLKRLILKEIHNVLKEDDDEDIPYYGDDEPEEEEEAEEPVGVGVYYSGAVNSAADFAADYGLKWSNPEESIQKIYDESATRLVAKRIKLKSGGTGDFYFQQHPRSIEGLGLDGYDDILIVAGSRDELEDEVGQAQREI
jgi:hypothetical protein